MDLKVIDFTVRKENLKEDILNLYSKLFGKVSEDEVHFEELRGGKVNVICRVTKKKDEHSVVFRNFGMKMQKEELEKLAKATAQSGKEMDASSLSSMFVNQTEIKVMTELAKHKICQPGVYCFV